MALTDPPSNFTNRRHDLDWLRIIAFALLIFYHVGMFYVTWGWHVKSPHANADPEYLMMLLNPWRLALLFFISGVAIRFLSDKLGSGRFAGDRAVRMLPVIVFGMLVIVMPQTWFELRQAGEVEAGAFWSFYGQYLRPGTELGLITPTWNHLWYVIYLLVYCLLLAPVIPFMRRIVDGPGGRMVGRLWSGPAGPALLLILPTAPFILYRFTVDPAFPNTHNLFWDWANHAHRLTILLYGFWAAKSPAFWGAVRRTWPFAFALGIAYAIALAWGMGQADTYWQDRELTLWGLRIMRIMYGWWAILSLLGLAMLFLNRDGPVRRYLTEAIFPFYILHQTITVAAGYYLAQSGLSVWPEFGLLVLATVIGSWAGFEIIKRIPFLRPLFGLKFATKTLDRQKFRSAD